MRKRKDAYTDVGNDGLKWVNVTRVGLPLCVGLIGGVLEVSRRWLTYSVNRRFGYGEWLQSSLVVACGMNRKKTYEREIVVMMK